MAAGSTTFDVTKTYVGSQTGTWSLGGVDDAESNTDYKLQHQVSDGVAAGTLDYGGQSFTAVPAVVGGNVDCIINRAFYNGSGGTVTVKEVGIYAAWVNGYAAQFYLFCIIRDLLGADVPVLDAETLTVEYTLRTNVAV
jgi:hypothetical protein